MAKHSRREMIRVGFACAAFPIAATLSIGCQSNQEGDSQDTDRTSSDPRKVNEVGTENGDAMKIHYLEIVTTDVDAMCALYSRMHGVAFGDADPNLGGARTASLANGGTLGIRGPLRDTETPVVRPYLLVEDIKASVAAAAESGAVIAMPPTEISGHGTFAIVIQGGIESGLWQH